MLKTKKIKNIIIILIIGYIIFNIISNVFKMGNVFFSELNNEFSIEHMKKTYEEEYESMTQQERDQKGMKPLSQISNEELEQRYQKNSTFMIVLVIGVSIVTTLFQNAYLIIIIVVIKVMSKKVLKEKLNKDDFNKNKEYYRDIIQGYGICELSLIDDFQLDLPSDIIAELLQLENKKIILREEDKLVIQEGYDISNLNKVQLYIIEHIKNGKITEVNRFELEEKVKLQALEDGLIEKRDNLKKRQIKRIIVSILVFIVAVIIVKIILNVFTSMHIENNTIGMTAIILTFLLIVFVGFWPMIAIISFTVYDVKSKANPYFRTKKGTELNAKIEGLKTFLSDYTLLDQKEIQEIVLWEDYLTYAVLFNQNKKIIQEYIKYIQE